MPADCDYSSSGESGSDGSCGRSQEDTGSFVLQKRSLAETPGRNEENGMFGNTPVASGHTVPEKPVLLTPGMNTGMEYWSSPTVSTGHEGLKPQYLLAPAQGTMPFNGASNEARGSGDMWSKDDREQKREKRKQANRESARRSRMRKQEQMHKV
eukprot:c21022_g1_i1 orf=240-701(+)